MTTVRPYTYTECFIRDINPKGFACLLLLMVIIVDTLWMPIFPIQYWIHSQETCDYIRKERNDKVS